MDNEDVRKRIAALVERSKGLSAADLRSYNEENTKKDFILPLFEALGWQVTDAAEVAAEHSAGRGRVDYTFRVQGVSRFYLEAKPLRNDLTDNREWVKQAISYAYSKSIPWVVLTNFKQLWVFTGDVVERRFLTLASDDFVGDFDKLWLLSRKSVKGGDLDEEAEKLGIQPPRISVERRLFEQLRAWRETIFRQVHLYHPELSLAQVDEVIQRLFNRLVFIRTCEDRRLEDPALEPLLRQPETRKKLLPALERTFRRFDGYYDSELFALHLVDQVHIDDNVIEDVIRGLYSVHGGFATYDFSAIDADILGQVYEQYLGHVARIAARRQREVQLSLGLGTQPSRALEEVVEVVGRPQHRKAQGIYYTPKWVTDYIVRQTVGRFVEENLDQPDRIHGIKVLDPACGSGSFLIRAYDDLLRWHAAGAGMPLEQLTHEYRMPVLRNNIFGVDLDQQAVEIARLNLLLRGLARRELLPSLAENIKRGNSLISGGAAELTPYFGDGWRDKHPFNWESESPEIMRDGGFDVIIGNPPYVRIQTLDRREADYYRGHYESAHGSFDIYVAFIERALKLLKPGGRLGFITSGKFLKAQYGKKLLELIRREATVEHVVDLSAQQVFAEATTYPAMIVMKRTPSYSPLLYTAVPRSIVTSSVASAIEVENLPSVVSEQNALVKRMWPPLATGDSLWQRLTASTEPLTNVAAKVFVGLQTSADAVYILQKTGNSSNDLIKVRSRATGAVHELERGLLKPFWTGKNISRYVSEPPVELVLFPYLVSKDTARLVSQDEFASVYPYTWEYLTLNRNVLEQREHGKMLNEKWYGYVYPKNLVLHGQPKLAIPSTVKRLAACYDPQGVMYLDNVRVNGILLKRKSDIAYKYMLGLLNSNLLHWFFTRLATPFANGWFGANRQFIEQLPIRHLDLSKPQDKAWHDRIVSLVQEMLDLQKRLSPIKDTPCTERDDLLREIGRKDREIDQVVYELYGLTNEEIAIVEGKT